MRKHIVEYVENFDILGLERKCSLCGNEFYLRLYQKGFFKKHYKILCPINHGVVKLSMLMHGWKDKGMIKNLDIEQQLQTGIIK